MPWLRAAVAAALALGLCLSSPPASAQTDDAAWDADAAPEEENAEENSEAEDEEASGEKQSDAEGEETPVAAGTALAPLRVSEEHRPDSATYRLPREQIWSPLEWAGGRMHAQIELDVGYASYKYPERQDRPGETEYDMRGRFVLGPPFRYPFGDGYFLDVVGQLVAWVREQDNEYQINADDVYVQVGNAKWDLQVGRFMTWRVYQKGLGFDLYTLEDNGASKSYPVSNGDAASTPTRWTTSSCATLPMSAARSRGEQRCTTTRSTFSGSSSQARMALPTIRAATPSVCAWPAISTGTSCG